MENKKCNMCAFSLREDKIGNQKVMNYIFGQDELLSDVGLDTVREKTCPHCKSVIRYTKSVWNPKTKSFLVTKKSKSA